MEKQRLPFIGSCSLDGEQRLVSPVLKAFGWATDNLILVIVVGQRARRICANVTTAVLETARGGILREGCGFDACDVAVVTNIASGDHLGLHEIDTPEQLAWVKGAIVAAVRSSGSCSQCSRSTGCRYEEMVSGSGDLFFPESEFPILKNTWPPEVLAQLSAMDGSCCATDHVKLD